jgi:hypothetical protein
VKCYIMYFKCQIKFGVSCSEIHCNIFLNKDAAACVKKCVCQPCRK